MKNDAAAPEQCAAALLLIDVINDLEFDGGAELLVRALPAARKIARLAERARAARVPVVYVNDNFGQWRSDFRSTVERCLEQDVRGQEIARLLRPHDEDYFVLKPKHSGFYDTVLETLLRTFDAHTVVLTGFAGDNCVLATAVDAYMRDFRVFIPSDAIASESAARNRSALDQMRRTLKADTRTSGRVDFKKLRGRSAGARMKRGMTTES